MKRWLLFSLFLLLPSAFVWASTPPKSITILTGETPPFASKHLKHSGYMNHIIQMAFRKSGVETAFIFMPWSRAYLESKQGDYPATSYWFADERHAPHFLYSKPLSHENVVFFKRKVSTGKWHELADLKRLGLKIGLTRGYTYTQEMWDYAEERPDLVSVVNTDLQNLKMLLLQRIDAFPIEEVTGWFILNKNFPKEQVQMIDISNEPLSSKSAHLFFSKAHPDAETYLSLFNAGIMQLEESGELDKMREDLVLGEYH